MHISCPACWSTFLSLFISIQGYELLFINLSFVCLCCTCTMMKMMLLSVLACWRSIVFVLAPDWCVSSLPPSTRSTVDSLTLHQTRCALTTATFAETPHSTDMSHNSWSKPVIVAHHLSLQKYAAGGIWIAQPLLCRLPRIGPYVWKRLDMNYEHFPH